MAKCAVCGEETSLHVMGRPICLVCEKKQNRQPESSSRSDPTSPTEDLTALWEKARIARLEYDRIVEEESSFAVSLGNGSEGVQFPDSLQEFKNLGLRRASALRKCELAWNAYLKSLGND